MKTIIIYTSLLLFLSSQNLLAQTGSFNKTLKFQNEDRTVSFYVPATYDSTQTYQLMVCLHGLGDNSTNYRNALINTLNWPALYPNTIFVFPDGGSDANKDFYMPAGDIGFIDDVITHVGTTYSVDTQAIVLQGFSLGGRSALKYGLEHRNKMKGLLLNTPAIQGLADLHNEPNVSLQFNYAQSAHFPISITVGEADYVYVYTLNELAKKLKKNQARIHYESIPGLGHTIPSTAINTRCKQFLVDKAYKNWDADVFEIQSGIHFCTKNISGGGIVRNNGDSVITSLQIEVRLGSSSYTFNWSGTLFPNQFTEVPMVFQAEVTGKQNLTARIVQINQNRIDEDTSNNLITKEIEIVTDNKPQSISQNFEPNEPGWYIHTTGSLFEWFLDNTVKSQGTTSIATFNTVLLFNTKNHVERFSSPLLSITDLKEKVLQFDVAFNYHKYLPPYVVNETVFADTLEILISTDCGATYSSLYKKGGAELATTKDPIVNPLTIQSCFFNPTPTEWRRETINLNAFATAENALITFRCISGMGGSMYLDRITLGETVLSAITQQLRESSFTVFPNPTVDFIDVTFPNEDAALVRLFDITGKLIQQHHVYGTSGRFELNDQPQGMYFVQWIQGATSLTKKIIKN